MPTRREFLSVSSRLAAIGLVGAALPVDAAAGRAPVQVTVYKSASCGCCKKWIEHVEAHGFAVRAFDVEDLREVKATAGVPAALQSCHTAYVGRYVVEGHVPADVMQRLLAERPAVAGLAVPGMPSGSPGMEGGGPSEHYDVIAFERSGRTRVYARR
jgi:hypothetical protein